MLAKQEKEHFRSIIFRHLDGIATASTAYALHKKSILKYLIDEKRVSLSEIAKTFKANEGYLNQA